MYLPLTEGRQIKLEEERARKRDEKKLTYDCFNALYPSDGTNRVRCSEGCRISGTIDGTIDVASVLKGRGGSGCQKCPSYDTEEPQG